MIILREAGGNCADFSGNEQCLFQEEIICSNGLNHNEFVDVIRDTMIEK
jgi:fructose-1,6-bisphosphatase/inositol monophosphatase family enzyme